LVAAVAVEITIKHLLLVSGVMVVVEQEAMKLLMRHPAPPTRVVAVEGQAAAQVVKVTVVMVEAV
jgi:hypothetical protein